MKNLILYATRHGATEKAARLLSLELGGDTTVVDLSKSPAPELTDFDTVVVGSAVYVGKVLEPVKKFVEDNAAVLGTKRLGLFICCANLEQAGEQLKANYPADLVETAVAKGDFGYAIQMDRMNFIERTAIKVIMKTRESSEHISEANIKQFAASLKL